MPKQSKSGSSRALASSAMPPPEPLTAPEAVAAAQGLVAGLTRIGGLARVDGLLETLRRSREFATLAALGSTLDQQGVAFSPRALRLTAQGLIETGRFSDARSLLDRVIDHSGDEPEILEARGLRGRIDKQRYVNEAVRGRQDAALLRSAVKEYLRAYDEHPQQPYWHGINAAALLARAARDGISGLPADRCKSI